MNVMDEPHVVRIFEEDINNNENEQENWDNFEEANVHLSVVVNSGDKEEGSIWSFHPPEGVSVSGYNSGDEEEAFIAEGEDVGETLQEEVNVQEDSMQGKKGDQRKEGKILFPGIELKLKENCLLSVMWH